MFSVGVPLILAEKKNKPLLRIGSPQIENRWTIEIYAPFVSLTGGAVGQWRRSTHVKVQVPKRGEFFRSRSIYK